MYDNNENEGSGVNFTLVDDGSAEAQNQAAPQDGRQEFGAEYIDISDINADSAVDPNPIDNNFGEANQVSSNQASSSQFGTNYGSAYAGNGYYQSTVGGFAPPQPEPEPVYEAPEPNPIPIEATPNYGYTNAANTATVMKLSGKTMALLIVIIIIACILSALGGGLIGANIYAGNNPTVVSGGNTNLTITPTSDLTTTEAVAKKVSASVVGITSTGTTASDGSFFGPSSSEVVGVGTGMILDKEGYILTNSHVVMDGSVNKITVLLSNGDEVEGTVIWNDAALDLAIVKINAQGLQPVELGNSDDIVMGSYVAAIGNPLGLQFNGSITQGVVSGLDRNIVASDGTKSTNMEGLIQVDAAINSGNSGGPLLNSQGQVIGVNTAKASGGEGMGFAIPINTALPIVEKVIESGSFERVYMGISAANVSVIEQNYPNVILHVDKGAVVTEVNPGSPAEQAGIKVKDVIIELDGKEITGSSNLIKSLLNYSSGDVAKIKLNRDGAEVTVDVTLVYQSEMQQVEPVEPENPFRQPQSR